MPISHVQKRNKLTSKTWENGETEFFIILLTAGNDYLLQWIHNIIIIKITSTYFLCKKTLKVRKMKNKITYLKTYLKGYVKLHFFLEFGLIIQHCVVYNQNT